MEATGTRDAAWDKVDLSSPAPVARDLLDRLCADDRSPPRLALVVAHPDDEVIGAGARLPRLPQAVLMHATDGSPRDLRDASAHGYHTREDYARARREELAAALELAGLSIDQALHAGLVDQEASFALPELARWLADRFLELRLEAVLTHPYEGGHPDHDATAFAVHAACRWLEARNRVSPVVLELTSYHDRDGWMAVGGFLSHPGCEEITLRLPEEARALKRRMYDCFRTQQEVIRYFPIELERFRIAPGYDFTAPPHPGTLYYERFSWGLDGVRWRALARKALDALGLEPRPDAGRQA